jgi:hypothetical protein
MKWLRWFNKEPEEAVEEIRVTQLPAREPPARNPLAVLLLECGSDEPGRAHAAAREIRQILAVFPAWGLTGMDSGVRAGLGGAWYHEVPEWARTPWAVEHLRQRVGGDVAVLCVLSMHPSGWVRQAAVEQIAELGQGELELPFLVLRSYDWVPQVRTRAEAAALKRLTADRLPRVLECLGLVLRLEQGLRGGHAVQQRVWELLRAPDARDTLRQGLRSADRATRLTCFAWLAEDDAELAGVVLDALTVHDRVLRGAAARAAERLPDAALPAVVPALIVDGSPQVRAQGVALAGRLDAQAEPLLLAAAMDVNTTVRTYARAELKTRGWTIDAGFYRAALAEQPESAAALAGLAETATAEDVEVIERYLTWPRVRLRRIAVPAYARLRRHDAVPALVRMLSDPSPRVSRAAADALHALGAAPADVDALLDSDAPHVRLNALRLLVRRGRWDGLVWALRARADSDARVREMGRGALARWTGRFNHWYGDPTPEQTARVGEALRNAAPGLSELERTRLQQLLPAGMWKT